MKLTLPDATGTAAETAAETGAARAFPALTRVGAGLACGLLALVISGCGAPPWTEEGSERLSSAVRGSGESTAEASPQPTASPSAESAAEEEQAEPTPAPIVGDLAAGSLDRSLSTGPVTLNMRYWSDANLDHWTAAASKPLSVRITAESSGDASLTALRAAVDARVDGAWENVPQSEVQVPPAPIDAAVSAPRASIQTVMIPAVPAGADAVRVTLAIDVVVEDGYSRDVFSALDTVTVALAD